MGNTLSRNATRRVFNATRYVERTKGRGKGGELRYGAGESATGEPYALTGIGTATLAIGAGTAVVIHLSATAEASTTVAGASGTLYREYTYATDTWGSWTIGTPTESATKRTFRRATITVTGGVITKIVRLASGILETYRWTTECA